MKTSSALVAAVVGLSPSLVKCAADSLLVKGLADFVEAYSFLREDFCGEFIGEIGN